MVFVERFVRAQVFDKRDEKRIDTESASEARDQRRPRRVTDSISRSSSRASRGDLIGERASVPRAPAIVRSRRHLTQQAQRYGTRSEPPGPGTDRPGASACFRSPRHRDECADPSSDSLFYRGESDSPPRAHRNRIRTSAPVSSYSRVQPSRSDQPFAGLSTARQTRTLVADTSGSTTVLYPRTGIQWGIVRVQYRNRFIGSVEAERN